MSAIPYADLTLPAPLTEAEAARVPGTLGRITAERVAAYRDAPLPDLNVAPARPGFAAALRSPGLHIIAEVKRRSPSLGAIADLEPSPRGPYCGAVGWVDVDRREAELAVGIRTFWAEHDQQGQRWLRFGAGSGITWDSDALGEWEESELKARRLIGLASGRIAVH